MKAKGKLLIVISTATILMVFFASQVMAIEAIVSLTAVPESESFIDEEITFTANAVGFNEPEYEFGYRRLGSKTWTSQGVGTDPILSVTPRIGQHGTYEVGVRVREVGTIVWGPTDVIQHTVKEIEIDPVSSVSLTATPSSPRPPGTNITFSAEADGGVNPEYAFYYRAKGTTTWTLARSYCTNNTFNATVNSAGDYEVAVIARSIGSKKFYEASDIINYTIYDSSSKIKDGVWYGVLDGTNYVTVYLHVKNNVITGVSSPLDYGTSIIVKYPYSNVTIVNFVYDDVSISKNGEFYYTRGLVTSPGGKIVVSGTFLAPGEPDLPDQIILGYASHEEKSSNATASMQYNWTGYHEDDVTITETKSEIQESSDIKHKLEINP